MNWLSKLTKSIVIDNSTGQVVDDNATVVKVTEGNCGGATNKRGASGKPTMHHMSNGTIVIQCRFKCGQACEKHREVYEASLERGGSPQWEPGMCSFAGGNYV
jgi:hypothetical protein